MLANAYISRRKRVLPPPIQTNYYIPCHPRRCHFIIFVILVRHVTANPLNLHIVKAPTRRGVIIYCYVSTLRILYIRRFAPWLNSLYFTGIQARREFLRLLREGIKMNIWIFQVKEEKWRNAWMECGRVLFPEKYLYIFHITFRVPWRHCRNYDDNDGGVLLCHVLEHLSPFARLVTWVTSRKPIDSVTLSI